MVSNIVDTSALRDIKDASAFERYQLPKLYLKQYYCVEAAVHQRIVRVRSVLDRKNRTTHRNYGRKRPNIRGNIDGAQKSHQGYYRTSNNAHISTSRAAKQFDRTLGYTD